MKRAFAFFLALVASAPLAFAQFRNGSALDALEDSETVRAFKQHVSYLASTELEGRKAGSEGEKLAADYVADYFKKYGIDVLSPEGGSTFGIAREADTLESRNVLGFLQGWDQSLNGRYIVVGARLDNLGADTLVVDGEPMRRIYYGANGNASGLAMMLELAQKLSYSRTLLRRSVLFVAFGASTQTCAGSWYFLNRAFSDADRIDAMVNLDMVGMGVDSFQAYPLANEDLSVLVNTLKTELLPVQPTLVNTEPYPGDHLAFYSKEIPSILFTTGRYAEHDTGRDSWEILDYDGMERELEYVYNYVQRLCNGQRPMFRNDDIDSREPARVGTVAFSDVDVKPMFLNSTDPRTFLEKWVYQYLKYPEYALKNGIQGRVVVDFVIDEKGEVRDVQVSRGIHTTLDDEAVRVISASPKWRPGRHRGKKVKVATTVAVDFRLDKKGTFGINGKTIK
jgi:TonB family protein